MEKEERCKECVYWAISEEDLEEPYAQCRRYAPRPTEPSQPLFIWPETHEDDWCGEFKGKRKTAKAAPLSYTK